VKLPSALTAFTLLVYAAAMTAYIYGVEHRPDADYAREEGADELVIFAIVALLHIALGVVVGRRALIAPPLPGFDRDSSRRLSRWVAGHPGLGGGVLRRAVFRPSSSSAWRRHPVDRRSSQAAEQYSPTNLSR
jgi:hypothetical protein